MARFTRYSLATIALPAADVVVEATLVTDTYLAGDRFILLYTSLSPSVSQQIAALSGPLILTCYTAANQPLLLPVTMTMSVLPRNADFGGLGSVMPGTQVVGFDDSAIFLSPIVTEILLTISTSTFNNAH